MVSILLWLDRHDVPQCTLTPAAFISRVTPQSGLLISTLRKTSGLTLLNTFHHSSGIAVAPHSSVNAPLTPIALFQTYPGAWSGRYSHGHRSGCLREARSSSKDGIVVFHNRGSHRPPYRSPPAAHAVGRRRNTRSAHWVRCHLQHAPHRNHTSKGKVHKPPAMVGSTPTARHMRGCQGRYSSRPLRPRHSNTTGQSQLCHCAVSETTNQPLCNGLA